MGSVVLRAGRAYVALFAMYAVPLVATAPGLCRELLPHKEPTVRTALTVATGSCYYGWTARSIVPPNS